MSAILYSWYVFDFGCFPLVYFDSVRSFTYISYVTGLIISLVFDVLDLHMCLILCNPLGVLLV